MHWHHDYWGMHTFWWIFWLVAVIAVVYVVRTAARRNHRDAPIEALRRSFAVGAISEEEYRRRRAVLEAPPVGEPTRGEPLSPPRR